MRIHFVDRLYLFNSRLSITQIALTILADSIFESIAIVGNCSVGQFTISIRIIEMLFTE